MAITTPWQKYATDDFQNRGNDYPESNIPDSIRAFENGVVRVEFNGTSSVQAKAWLMSFSRQHGLPVNIYSIEQTGDYPGDHCTIILNY